MRRIAIAACATALLIAGCGGGGDDEPEAPELPKADQVKIDKVTDTLVASVADQDGKSVCEILQPSLVKETFGSLKKCAKQVNGNLGQAMIPANLKIVSFEVNGEGGAIATFNQEFPKEAAFVKENGNWYIDLSSLVSGPPASDSSAGQ